jgi:CPA1 family monovalent cation:H+ antiporter
MQLFDVGTVLLILAAACAYLNHRFLRLPPHIGTLVLSLLASGALIALSVALPHAAVTQLLGRFLAEVDLPHSLLNGFLCFLLFAGTLHVDLEDLLTRSWTISAIATLGVILSTFLIGGGMAAIFAWLGIPVPLAYCLAFGALISPTDPIVVLGMLKRIGVPPGLQAVIAGEALFNDGVGIILFTLFLAIARGEAGPDPGVLAVAGAFVLETGGAIALGLAMGGIAYLLFRSIDEANIEIMLSLALVMATYSLADRLAVSGPIAVVVAGLLTGHQAVRHAMSEDTVRHLHAFWDLVDEILNAVLFLLIGLSVAAIEIDPQRAAAAAIAIPLCLAARFLSVVVIGVPLNVREPRKGRAIVLMTWAGLRGGISVALALGIDDPVAREPLLAACYAVVLFTMLVQGLTVGWLARHFYGEAPASSGGGTASESASFRG